MAAGEPTFMNRWELFQTCPLQRKPTETHRRAKLLPLLAVLRFPGWSVNFGVVPSFRLKAEPEHAFETLDTSSSRVNTLLGDEPGWDHTASILAHDFQCPCLGHEAQADARLPVAWIMIP